MWQIQLPHSHLIFRRTRAKAVAVLYSHESFPQVTQYDAHTALLRLAALLDTVRQVDATFPAQALHVLTIVAVQPGITSHTIMHRAGISQASTSRNLMKLGDWPHAARYSGLDLLNSRPSPHDNRYHMHSLTAKGRTFMGRVLTAQTGEHFTSRDLPQL